MKLVYHTTIMIILYTVCPSQYEALLNQLSYVIVLYLTYNFIIGRSCNKLLIQFIHYYVLDLFFKLFARNSEIFYYATY